MYTRIIFRISLSKHVFAMVIHVSIVKVLMLLKTESVKTVFNGIVSPSAVLCTDNEKAYHSSLKSFIDRFHGVSTKHLEHYIIWNNLIANNKRSKTENISLMFVQILSRRLTVHNSDISARPPLSFVT